MTASEYKAGRIKPSSALKDLANLKREVQNYRQLVVKFYREFRSPRCHYTVSNCNTENKEPEYRKAFPVFEGDKFDSFTMRLGRKDTFRKGNQVYFRYGRLSNRKMLECYGMAIEGNKYDHLWVRLDGLRYLASYPDMLELMQNRRLSLKFKFKLKRREFSMEMVLFFRLANWSRMRHTVESIFAPEDPAQEIRALEAYLNMLRDIQKASEKESVLVEKLMSKDITYHKYFATVYRLEHVRIVNMHFLLV